MLWGAVSSCNRGVRDEELPSAAGGPPVATEKDTQEELLKRAGRDAVPLRKSFVQIPRTLATNGSERSGPLSVFVRHRDLRGLQAYLMTVAATSSGDNEDGWSTTHPIMVWARAFGTTRDAERASAATAVSKILRRLEKRQLIQRSRRGRERKIRVTLLREDGSGQPYDRPVGRGAADQYLNLSHAFWLEDWCERLSLPGLAMLLVALSETGPKKPSFRLPTEHMPQWYGWSADTAERGLTQLVEHQLLLKIHRVRKEPLSAIFTDPSGDGRAEFWVSVTGPGDTVVLQPCIEIERER